MVWDQKRLSYVPQKYYQRWRKHCAIRWLHCCIVYTLLTSFTLLTWVMHIACFLSTRVLTCNTGQFYQTVLARPSKKICPKCTLLGTSGGVIWGDLRKFWTWSDFRTNCITQNLLNGVACFQIWLWKCGYFCNFQLLFVLLSRKQNGPIMIPITVLKSRLCHGK